MSNSFGRVLSADNVKLTISSTYKDDYLIIQQANNCIVLDITAEATKLDIHELLTSLEFRKKDDLRRKKDD